MARLLEAKPEAQVRFALTRVVTSTVECQRATCDLSVPEPGNRRGAVGSLACQPMTMNPTQFFGC